MLHTCRLQAISASVQQVEQHGKMRSLILTSRVPNLFSAGLDIREMHNPDPDRLVSFWKAFQNVYFHLYGSKLACIAAMGGHAPAAGCMLALSCDYRIMASKSSSSSSKPFTIGLNESKLGIVAPPWLAQQFIDTVGTREAEKGMCLGLLYTPEQALKIGLVDEVVASVEEVQTQALGAAIAWGQIPPQALFASKMLNRRKHIQHLKDTQQQDVDNFCNFVLNEKVQRAIGAYLASLSKNK
jgi:3,2-trans-enoyl-CoA isomerase